MAKKGRERGSGGRVGGTVRSKEKVGERRERGWKEGLEGGDRERVRARKGGREERGGG